MSVQGPSPWKVGLFVVIGVSAMVAAVFWLAAGRLNREVLVAVTYFNESVEGLDVGSPIKIRGVTVGRVADIGIAPDHRMVIARMGLYESELEELGLWPPPPDFVPLPGRLGPSDLRVQLASSGITGVKFIQADFFDSEQYPLPELSFPPEPNYVPSVPSTLKSVGDALVSLADELPAALADIGALARTVQTAFEDARVQNLAERLDTLLAELDTKLGDVDVRMLSDELVVVARDVSATARLFQEWLVTMTEEGGPIEATLASWKDLAGSVDDAELGETARALRDASSRVGDAADSLRALGVEGTAVTLELERDLGALRQTLEALRALAVLLERDPGALLRGRASGAPHPLETSR